jgi:hypothetical protein
MKAKKTSRKGKPGAKRATKDLPPKKTREVKGGWINPGIFVALSAQQHETNKSIVQNLPR